MKKILAALLVVVMVVSLFPATVLANSDECKVVEEYGAHSKAHCDALGVKYTQFGETVKPECGQDGYTTYKCACGVYFADDIVDMPEHTYEPGAKPVTARVEPTCSAYGKAAFFTCVHCDQLFPVYMPTDVIPEDEDAPAGAIEKVDHTFGDNTYPGNDCTAETQICTVCKAEVKNENHNEFHNFGDYDDPHAITKAPGTCGHGVAVFKCENEGCTKTIEVAVNFEGHEEGSDQFKFVKEKAATCTATGVKAHYECKLCKATFGENEDGEFVPMTAEDLTIPVTHSWDDEPTYSQLPTCEKYGADYYQCINCGANKVENQVAPLGHTTYEEALAHDADPELVKKDGEWLTVVKATSCTDKTTYTWYCQKECYCAAEKDGAADPQKAVCGKEMTKRDAAKGHTEVTVKVPATVEYPYEYTMVFCTDPNCDADAVVGEVTEDLTGEDYVLNVAVKVGEDGNVYEMLDSEKAAVHFVEFTKVTAKETEKCGAHYYELNSLIAPTCTANGTAVYICTSASCGYDHKSVTVSKLGHDNSDYSQYVCGTETKVLCTRCGTATKVAKADAVHKIDFDKFIMTLEVPNCRRAAGDYYECEYCGLGAKGWGIVDETSPNYKKYSYQSVYNSLEDAMAAHSGDGMPGTGKFTVIDDTSYPGDCEVQGKVEYSHSSCGKHFFVLDETTGTHVPPAGLEPYEEATCHHGAGYPDYTCTRCGEEVKAAAPLEHELSELIPEVKPTCTTGGNLAYYTCSRECCAYTVLDKDGNPVLDENGEEVKAPGAVIAIEYEDEDENGLLKTFVRYIYMGDVENVMLSATGHNMRDYAVVAANCTTAGYQFHECVNEDCEYNYVDNYVKATGHDKADKATETKPTCSADGEKYFKCENAGCTGDDGIAGTEDDGKLNYEVLPALGHINAEGKVFYNKCTDTTADRVCIRKDCDDITIDPETGKREPIAKNCDMTDWAWVEECCEHEGYWFRVCENNCGRTEMDIWYDALGHQFAWGYRAGLEYVNASDVAYYGNWYLEHYYRFAQAYGADAIKAYTPATYEKKGSITFTCADCGDVVTLDVQYVPVEFSVELDNALVAGANDIKDVNGETYAFVPADGDIIAIDVNMNAFEIGVWGFNFDFQYDASVLNYLGYTFHANDIFKTTLFNHYYEDDNRYDDVNNDGVEELVYTNENALGVVKVLAYNDKKEDTTITGTEKVVTLYFQVDAYYEYTELGRVQSAVADHFVYRIVNGGITNAKGEAVLADFGYMDGAYVGMLMDANLDGTFNVEDIYAAADAIVANTYIAGADIDKDGDVDFDDLVLMSNYMVCDGSKDALISVLLARKPWTAPEGFVAA